MRRLKKYENLFQLYRRGQNKWLLASGILLLMFLLSFVAIIVDAPFAISLIMMLMIIPAIFVGITALIIRHVAPVGLAWFTDEELHRMNQELMSVQMQEGFAVTRDAIISTKGRKLLYPVKDVMWVYYNVITTRLYGIIPIMKETELMIVGKDKKRHGCRVRNKSKVLDFMQTELSRYRKGIFFGYSEDFETMFCQDINGMVEMSEKYENGQSDIG